MKNCIFCHKPIGTQFVVLLAAKYGEENTIDIYDDVGVACTECVEGSDTPGVVKIGNLKLRFE